MSQRESLLAKINGLVLANDANREKLKKLVEKAVSDEELKRLDELVSEEEAVIEKTVEAILETELDAGELSIVEVLEKALKEVQGEEKKAAKKKEEQEKASDEKEAEALIHKF